MTKAQTDEEREKVDTRQYCTYLTSPPVADENRDYQTHSVGRFYICAITGKPCVARYIEDRTGSGDIFEYSRPKIHEPALKECAYNGLSTKIVLEIVRAKRKMEDERFEERLRELEGGK